MHTTAIIFGGLYVLSFFILLNAIAHEGDS